MSKNLTVFSIIVVVCIGYFLVHNLKNSYELLPFNESLSENTFSSNSSSQAKNLQSSITEPHEWKEFSSPSEYFKVLLPSYPQHTVAHNVDPKTKEQRKYEAFVSPDKSGAVFMINAVSYASIVTDEALEESLKNVVNEMLERNKGNKLKDMHFKSFRDKKSLEFSLINGDLYIGGLIIANDKTIYILSMIDKESSFNSEEMNFFINSFELTEKNATIK